MAGHLRRARGERRHRGRRRPVLPPQRIAGEIATAGDADAWLGWLVARDGSDVVGAGGGGITAHGVGEVVVLYLDPDRRGEGIGCCQGIPSLRYRRDVGQ